MCALRKTLIWGSKNLQNNIFLLYLRTKDYLDLEQYMLRQNNCIKGKTSIEIHTQKNFGPKLWERVILSTAFFFCTQIFF